MDLFVINRHHEPELHEEIEPSNEEEKMQKILNKVEKNKKLREKQKKAKKNNKEQLIKAIEKTKENRQHKRFQRQLQETVVNAQNILCESKEIIEKLSDGDNIVNDDQNVRANIQHSDNSGFLVLGSNEFQKKAKVKRVLPKWLSEPTVISTNLQNLQTKVSEIKGLDKSIRKILKQNGIRYFFPVQATVIPWFLQEMRNSSVIFPRDICVSAPTGSGKTLVFVLPIVHCLKRYTVKKIRALIILPTQDLALQVFKTFKTYTSETHINTCLITGKNPFDFEQQQLVEERGSFGYISKVDILVCTAGRLVDHLKNTKGLDLHELEFLVIDEADRVLDSVQNDWLYHLEKHIQSDSDSYQSIKMLNLITLRQKKPPQKLLFSATLTQDPEKLQKLSLFEPKLFTSIIENDEASQEERQESSTFLGKYTTPQELTEKYIVCSIDLKPLVLYEFIKEENLTKTLIFTNSAESAHRLTILLNSMFKESKKIKEMLLSADINKKNEFNKSFANGEIDILVCTDRLARGIDLPGVECVVSYGAPKYIKSYIHRVGRTARAGQSGLAVTLLHKSQLNKFQAALSQAHKTNLEEVIIDENTLESLADHYKQALGELKDVVLKEEEVILKKMKQNRKPRKILPAMVTK